MRAVRDLEDVKLILKELMDWKDKLSGQNWDFHGLRIKNASPSKDPYDYVVRKELKDSTDTINKTVQGTGGGVPIAAVVSYYTIVFCCTGDIAVGSEVSPPYMVPRAGQGIPVEAYIAAVVAPVGADIIVQIIVNGINIFHTDFKLLDGDKTVVFSDLTAPTQRLQYKDIVNINVMQVGSTTPGANVSIELRVQKI